MSQALRSPAAPVESLTILRGLAATAVVLTHGLRCTESLGRAAPPPFAWLDVGNFAVDLFFCLSGFTLVLAHRDQRWDWRGWASFLVRRVCRVYPAFLVSFVLCWALLAWLLPAGLLPAGSWLASTNRLPDPAIAAALLTFTSNLFGQFDYVNTAFWSMPVEFQFYLMFPLLLLLRRRSAGLVVAAALLLFALDWVARWPDRTLSLLWIFAAGMLAAWRYADGKPGPPRLLAAAAALLAFAAACVLSNLPAAALHRLVGPIDLYFGALAAVIVWAAARLDDGRRAGAGRVRRALLNLGDVSYSVYLFHTPVIFLLLPLLRAAAVQGGAALALLDALLLPATWCLANLTWRAVEQPAIAQGRRLSRRLAAKVAA